MNADLNTSLKQVPVTSMAQIMFSNTKIEDYGFYIQAYRMDYSDA